MQISTLARQMYPSKSQFLVDAYQNATKQSYGYLMLDLKPTTPDTLRVRTQILPNDLQVVYVNKDDVTEKHITVS